LIAVIPILTLGFNAFEKKPFYARLFDIYGIESAITRRLTTQYGNPGGLIIDREHNKEEFDDLWKLILKYSDAKISRNNPKIISRLAIENSAYVTIPQKGKVILIPDTVPVSVMYCAERQMVRGDCKDEDSVMIEIAGDIKE
jgi:hypothetical protein